MLMFQAFVHCKSTFPEALGHVVFRLVNRVVAIITGNPKYFIILLLLSGNSVFSSSEFPVSTNILPIVLVVR